MQEVVIEYQKVVNAKLISRWDNRDFFYTLSFSSL